MIYRYRSIGKMKLIVCIMFLLISNRKIIEQTTNPKIDEMYRPQIHF